MSEFDLIVIGAGSGGVAGPLDWHAATSALAKSRTARTVAYSGQDRVDVAVAVGARSGRHP